MPGVTTQQFLEIDQIKEGIVILRDKSLRAILIVSSMNFALKSDDEQTAIIYQFQNFLNSLDFSCQVLVQSRRLNITSYLDRLKELEQKQANELLKVQTKSYREFIESMIKKGTIMTKNFFVVIPFHPPLKIRQAKKKVKKKELTETEFQAQKFQLWQRVEFVAMGLKRCGLQAVPLMTNELIELFWTWHHPKEAEFGYYPEIPPELIR